MKYNWNEETVQHFKFESFYEGSEKIEQRIREFVELDCIPKMVKLKKIWSMT